MRCVTGGLLVALMLPLADARAQVNTFGGIEPGKLIRVTYMSDSGQVVAQGRLSIADTVRVVMELDDETRAWQTISRGMVNQVEVGDRGNTVGVIGALVGVGAGIAISLGARADEDDSCYPVCDDDSFKILSTMVLVAIPVGLGLGGYFLGHQFDPLRWTQVLVPPIGRQ